jgi:hypothetical protein
MMQDDDGLVEAAAKAAWEEAAKPEWSFWFSGMSWDDTAEDGMTGMRDAFIACTKAVLSAIEREGYVIRRKEQIERDAECPSCRGTKGRHFMGCQRPIGTVFG